MNGTGIRQFDLRKTGWTILLLGILIPAGTAAAPAPNFRTVSPQGDQAGFQRLPAASTGIVFTNVLAEHRHLTNQIFLNGSGLAAGDVDGDGWCDLYFCQLDGPNALYRNVGGFKFQDITPESGAACAELDSTGAALADLDGDGDLDLVVNSVGGGTHCFINDSQARFTASPHNTAMNPRSGGTSLAFADVDGDADLDLYVANYRTVTIRDQPNTRFSFKMIDGEAHVVAINGRALTHPDYTNRFHFKISLNQGAGNFSYEENGEPDVLYLNDGQGQFTPVSFTSGAFSDEQGQALRQPPFDWGLSVLFRDLNGDLTPDLYVCNDFRSPDRVWLNDGRGRFRALPRLALRQLCLSSMGADIADINRDGYDDIFALDMLSRDHHFRLTQRIDIAPEIQQAGEVDNRPQFSRNMLFLNRGDGAYAEIAQFSGLEAAEWSWMPAFLDVDLDGYEDVLIPNGFERDNMNVDALNELQLLKKQSKLTAVEQLRLRQQFPRLATANLAFRNRGDLKFDDKSADWNFDSVGISQSLVLADLDNDGDLDVAINNLNDVAGIYRNTTPAPRVAVRLNGKAPNTKGIGAKIRFGGGPVPQSQEMMAGGRYLSGDDNIRVFACGEAVGGMTIEVNWRSGRRSLIREVQPNRIYEVVEEDSLPPIMDHPMPPWPRPFFQDVSELLSHRHHEEPFDDFGLQPMLPKRLSQLGPGLCWLDWNGDGWEDLIIGSGRGGRLALFQNNGQGAFQLMAVPAGGENVLRDQTSILSWRSGAGQARIVIGSSNYEDGNSNASPFQMTELPSGKTFNPTSRMSSSAGPLALADVDGDGDLDLFVGGRILRGRYPSSTGSSLYRMQSDGQWELDPQNTRELAQTGMVSGAVFADLDADGDADLALACEWGPIRIFRNDEGALKEVTEALKMNQYLGWWNGVTVGDFDQDGRLDLAASNWGQNSKYEFFRHRSLRVFFGDVDGNSTTEVIEAYYHPGMKQLAPGQPYHLIVAAIPVIADQLGSCAKYADSSLEGVYGAALPDLEERQANWLESTVFLNRGSHFEPRALPAEAQLSPAFAVCVGDLDHDGHEDLFLSQNFFAVPPETSRYDAGRGLWLRGDGRGGFAAVPGRESGLKIYGEQRAAALCDFDGDGRVDLAVTQNAAETKLYRNRMASPGLRVRLMGPPENLDGIGAILRIGTAKEWGPARAVHAGSGYWSQESAVQVMARSAEATRIQVRWPGGKLMTSTLPKTALEISIDLKGLVKVLR